VRTVPPRPRFVAATLKAALFLGFGLIAGIWLFAGDVAAVASGKSFFSPAVADVMLDDYVKHLVERGVVDRYDALSEREREIFQLIATLETDRAHIFQKLDLHNAAEVVLFAVRRGIVS
jgi:DNA-binding NarL/FixJ family response regulator